MALHVGHNCNPWEGCDVCGAKVEPPYSQRTDVCAMCRQGFTLCRCRHQLREQRERMNMTKEEALSQMTTRWLEDEELLRASVLREDVENLRAQVLERTSLDMRGTVDRLFAEVVSKTVRR
jgi:hypothetical protein